ncbi:hypothetical protein BJY24_000138 [Nocardia transvalensis]|uniref:Uncharacterized protein n=1 Tax=Nocardia transvalensis TaxID=37333 RepID=A0A7W9P864_9NOCA|nr:hypothetical protein [Nocardia transvalensis]MBB5911271.1 hypothetical protein [Nocardia transvalensis]
MVAGAVAIGASEGARQTVKKIVTDSYDALRQWIVDRYAVATAAVEEIESDPSEELRRQLLAKKLRQAGAGEDAELQDLAQALLNQIEEHAPGAAAAVGVRLQRVEAGGDIEVIDVEVEGGSGVTAEDVSAGGSVRIQGVKVRATQEPPHPPRARR